MKEKINLAIRFILQVARDYVLKVWKFPEGENASGPWGSGYPGIDL